MKKTMENSRKRMRRGTGADDPVTRLLEVRRPLPEIPHELDSAVLAAARTAVLRRSAASVRPVSWFRRPVFRMTAAAASAALLACGVAMYAVREHREVVKTQTELLSMWDFSSLEQSGYNLNFELDSRQNDPYAGLAMR